VGVHGLAVGGSSVGIPSQASRGVLTAARCCPKLVGRLCYTRPALCKGLLVPPRRFDYSEWVRVYARYLDEQLEVYAKTTFYQVHVPPLCKVSGSMHLRRCSASVCCVFAPLLCQDGACGGREGGTTAVQGC